MAPEQAQAAADQAHDPTVESVASIPGDFLSVSGFWSHAQDQYGEWWTFFGQWDFREDNYAGGDAPRDAMAVATDQVNGSCWWHDGDDARATSANGDDTSHRLSRKGASISSAVWEVNDDPGSGIGWGSVAVDRGYVYISYRRGGYGCSGPIYGRAFYEHNLQGCNCTWTYGINIGAFTITYSHSPQPVSSQRSTTLIRAVTD